MHQIGAYNFISRFSYKFRCLKDMIPPIVPKAMVWPSALQAEEMIFYLNFSLGISFLPGVYKAKSAAPPLKSSCVNGLKQRVNMA